MPNPNTRCAIDYPRVDGIIHIMNKEESMNETPVQ